MVNVEDTLGGFGETLSNAVEGDIQLGKFKIPKIAIVGGFGLLVGGFVLLNRGKGNVVSDSGLGLSKLSQGQENIGGSGEGLISSQELLSGNIQDIQSAFLSQLDLTRADLEQIIAERSTQVSGELQGQLESVLSSIPSLVNTSGDIPNYSLPTDNFFEPSYIPQQQSFSYEPLPSLIPDFVAPRNIDANAGLPTKIPSTKLASKVASQLKEIKPLSKKENSTLASKTALELSDVKKPTLGLRNIKPVQALANQLKRFNPLPKPKPIISIQPNLRNLGTTSFRPVQGARIAPKPVIVSSPSNVGFGSSGSGFFNLARTPQKQVVRVAPVGRQPFRGLTVYNPLKERFKSSFNQRLLPF
jgi:hypothetical protein